MIKRTLAELSRKLNGNFCFELPNGSVIGQGSYKVRIKSWKALRSAIKDPEMGFGESYTKGDIQVEGDLERFIAACFEHLKDKGDFKNSVLRPVFKHLGLLKFIEGIKVRRHYDLGNGFYKLWLDSSMTYSCAFFSKKDMSLEEAQAEKRWVIYQKLQLRDDDRLLDIGCGWGSLIIEAAKLYNIKAVGISLSKNQYEYTKSKIEEEGIKDRVRVYLMHYEDLPNLGQKWNKVVSVGMFEHVGKGRHRRFFQIISRIMEDGGIFLLHTIGKVLPEKQSRWIRKYIFPGGYIPALTEILETSGGLGFNLIDIDNWRVHYYLTLREWRKRFYERAEDVKALYGERFFRMWELYLVASAVSFITGSNHLFQVLFSKGVVNYYPVMMRKFLASPFADAKLLDLQGLQAPF
ncbi:MAG: class I SAM-dependent methyltransferase [Aquificaceae bacterium]